MSTRCGIVAFLLAVSITGLARAESPATQPASKPSDDKAVITEHEVKIDGQSVHYTATASEMPIKDDAGKVRAKVFFVAYEKKNATTQPADLAARRSAAPA